MIREAKSDENPYKSQVENMEYVYRTLKIIDIFDDHIRGSGAVGLWTKEDSVTAFDDFSYGE